jgi:hypothetical protein
MLKAGILTEEDRLVIRQWAQTIMARGPEAVRVANSVWGDHTVIRITATHDYGKGRRS